MNPRNNQRASVSAVFWTSFSVAPLNYISPVATRCELAEVYTGVNID